MVIQISLFSLIMLLFTAIMMKLSNKFSDKDENKWSACFIIFGIIVLITTYYFLKK